MKAQKRIIVNTGTEVEITGATLLSREEAKLLLREERMYGSCWWLRSSGDHVDYAMLVGFLGYINFYGYDVDDTDVCVRPALKVSNLQIGDTFEINGYEFKVISEDLAWMHKQDIGRYAFNDDYSKGNDYETSSVKKIIDEWFETFVQKIPYVDVTEVKHGGWVEAHDTSGHNYQRCTACGVYIEDIFFANDYSVNFCPNCGADMRERKKE